ncbi:MAG: DMT family transporter [Flavobacteriales bacterium]|nr:DMT family transporter [Flavobacteriales bacterium]MBT6013547.1 DMT family transporter [Flavobacteriales bacterium]MBT7481098.1 DMT family transporter [Flavobacteriales bacterium]
MNKIVLAHLSLLVANLIYAINYTLAKDVMPDYIKPSGFILLRVIGALFLFALSYFLFIKEKIEKKDIIRFAICGLFGVAINQLLFFEGLNLTTPINAAIIMTSNPILVIIMSLLILKEKITLRKGLGIILGIVGASSLILNGGDINLSSDAQIGNLFIFINATSYGLYLVLVKPLMKKYKPITVMFYVFAFGLLLVFPFGIANLYQVNWNDIPTNIYWEISFVVVCTTFIAYLFNSSALKELSPTTVSIYIYLQPILATLFAILRESDSLDKQKIISSAIIFLGVYLVSVRSKKQSKRKLS